MMRAACVSACGAVVFSYCEFAIVSTARFRDGSHCSMFLLLVVGK